MKRVVFDTNIFVAWLRRGAHEDHVLGGGRVRLLSCVVEMELRAGVDSRRGGRAVDGLVVAYSRAARRLCPTPAIFAEAGRLLPRLSRRGVEVRRASLVNDVLIALSARSVGATVVTRDKDYARIRALAPFDLELVAAQ